MDAGEKYDDECSSVFAASSLMRRRQKLLLRKAAVGEGLEGTDDQAAPRLSRTASPIEVAVGVETPAAEPTKRPSLPILSRSRANSLASSSRPSLSRAGSPTEGVQLSSEEGPGTGPDSSSSILWQVAKRFVRQLSPAEGEAASAGTAFPFPTEEVAKPSPHQQVDSSGSAKGVAVDAEEEEDGCSSVLSAFSSPERFETAAAWDSVDVPEDEAPRLSRTFCPIEVAVGVETLAATTKRPSLQTPSQSRASPTRPSLSRTGSPTCSDQQTVDTEEEDCSSVCAASSRTRQQKPLFRKAATCQGFESEDRAQRFSPDLPGTASPTERDKSDSPSSFVWQAAKRLLRAGSDYQAMHAEEEEKDQEDGCSSVLSVSSWTRRQPGIRKAKTCEVGWRAADEGRQKPLLRKAATCDLEVAEDQSPSQSPRHSGEFLKAMSRRLSGPSKVSLSMPANGEDQARSTSFPMYTVSAPTLLKLQNIEPHEELKLKGLLSVFSQHMGKAVFVSHECVPGQDPDMMLEQLKVLQDALRTILFDLNFIPPDPVGERLFNGTKGISSEDFKCEMLYLWYDYFSCPQLHADREDRRRLISCIPKYVQRCDFFFALCPTLQTPEGKLLGPHTWAKRAWCRFEITLRELWGAWILVQSPNNMHVMVQTQLATAYGGPCGEGELADEEDKEMFAEALTEELHSKLMSCLRAGDVLGYRAWLNFQSVLLRGLEAEPVCDLVPGFESGSEDVPILVQQFFFQNGFTSVTESDEAGWSPLAYACLAGDSMLIQALLEQRADPGVLTRKANSCVNVTAWSSTVSLCAQLRQNDAMRLLISARASLDSGWNQPINSAAVANNAEGIRILCNARASLECKNTFGLSPLENACAAGALSVVDELLIRLQALDLDLSRTLHFAMWYRGGTTEIASRLLDARATVNQQLVEGTRAGAQDLLETSWAHRSLQFRMGIVTTSTILAYNRVASTPLMIAVLSGQHAGAMELIRQGANLNIRNSRLKSVADLVEEVGVPSWLTRCLEEAKSRQENGLGELGQLSVQMIERLRAVAGSWVAVVQRQSSALS